MKKIPAFVENYQDDMTAAVAVDDGTQSYVSKLLIGKDMKQYVIVAIKNEYEKAETEILLPDGVILHKEGNYKSVDDLLREVIRYKEHIMKFAKENGIYQEGDF